mmetsp:Transcript_27104/g.42544  ORF Transcript_27104/g.42544 Transcript_27104/m.42544 type:complete len:95 (+) Transcript_27104:746-1030(+)
MALYKTMMRSNRSYLIFFSFKNTDSEMAGRHRCRFRSIQIIRTGIVAAKDVRRPAVMQYLKADIKFPLAHRIPRAAAKKNRSTFKASRPTTFLK